jgi:hypothetical protein
MGVEYQPGECNIGRPERRVRYGFGAVGFAAAGALVAAAVVLSWPRWTLLSTVVPLFGGFIGVIQGRKAFCVRYAWAGIHNVSDRLGDATTVADRDAAREDHRRAQRLVAQSAGYAAAVALALYLVVPL